MRYYRRIFSLLLSILISFNLLGMIIIVLIVSVNFHEIYKHHVEQTAEQLAVYTDKQLVTAQLCSFLVSSSDINNRFNLVILNDFACNIELFMSLFYMTKEQVDSIQLFFSENPVENSYYLSVMSSENQKLIVYVQCEQNRYPFLVYFFSLFYENQLFKYKDMPVYSSGSAAFDKRNSLKIEQSCVLFGHTYTYCAVLVSSIMIYTALIALYCMAVLFVLCGLFCIITRKVHRPIEDLLDSVSVGVFCLPCIQDSVSYQSVCLLLEMNRSYNSCRNILFNTPATADLSEKTGQFFDTIEKRKQKGYGGINPILVENMLSFVHSQYVRDISLDDLAEMVHLSAGYVSTVFKKAVGINFKEYLNYHRYKQACHNITTSPHLRIKEVAALTGCNTEILGRLFMRYSGMLPTDFQRKVCAEKHFDAD